jgi:hypothetical protein
MDILFKFQEYLNLKLDVDCFSFEYTRTSRTLCPDYSYSSPHYQGVGYSNEVIVSVSTASPYNLNVSLYVSQETDFPIK